MSGMRNVMALGLAGALASVAISDLRAAPVPTNTAAVKAAAPDSLIDVRWGGWGGWRGGWGGWRGGWWPGAAIAGVALGAAVAAPYYYGCGYPYYYGYGCGYPSRYSYGAYWGGYGPGYAGYYVGRPAYWGGYPGYWGARRAYWGGYYR